MWGGGGWGRGGGGGGGGGDSQYIIHKKQPAINPFIHILNILKLKIIQNYMDI